MRKHTPENRVSTRRRRVVTFAAIFVVPGLVCGLLYNAKMHRDLNRKLIDAVKLNDTESAELLLAHGAYPNLRDVPEKQLSLWQQIRGSFHQTVSRSPDDRQYPPPPTLLEIAFESREEVPGGKVITRENAPLVKALLDAGAPPDDSSYLHITPLMRAVTKGWLRTARLLLAHGANVNARSEREGSALVMSTAAYQGEATRLLLHHGAEVNVHDTHGVTPLYSAVCEGSLPVVEMLFARGAKVDPIDRYGETPLIVCLQVNPRPDIVKALLAKRADVDHQNRFGRSARSIAKQEHYHTILRMLEAASR